MRTFPVVLAADLARRNGAAPVWLLRFTASGIDYVLCQDAIPIPPWDKTALPWIASWGQLTEGVSSTLADFNVSALNVALINDPAAAPNLRTLAKAGALTGVAVSVYLWVDGCTDAPFEMFRFRQIGLDLPDEASVNIEMQDESSRHENSSPGTIITKEDHPSADPDDIGKIIPIPFGTVSKLTAVALDSGRITSIPNAISATAISFAVSDATGLSGGMALKIDDEIVELTSISGDVLAVTRGTLGTLATTHQRGAMAWELKDEFIYAVADFPVTSMPKAYGRVGQAIMDISGLCTVWPTGNHPDYPGKAVVSVPGYITAAQAVDMMATDGIEVEDLLQLIDSMGFSDTFSVSDLIEINNELDVSQGSHTHPTSTSVTTAWPNGAGGVLGGTAANNWNGTVAQNCWDANAATYMTGYAQSSQAEYTTLGGINAKIARFYYSTVNNISNCLRIRVGAVVGVPWNYGSRKLGLVIQGALAVQLLIPQGTPKSTLYTGWVSFTSMAALYNYAGASATSFAFCTVSAITDENLYDIWFEIETGAATTYSSATGVVLLGDVGRIGETTIVGGGEVTGTISRSAENVKKTGTVTLSGNSVANTLIGDAILVDVVSPITAPRDVITKILGTPCNLIGTFPAGYAFNGAITSSRRAPEWCHELARQCRAYFKWVLGQPTLIVRPDVLAPVKSIDEIRLSNGMMIHGQRQTDINDVINTINLRYDRDWSSTSSGDEVYQQVSAGTDAASITTYGVRERPELFRFDFVTTPTMAASLAAFYRSWYAWQRWQHTQECYLFEAAMEFGDAVTLAYLGGEIGECTEVGFSPGAGVNIDKIQLTVIE